MVISDSDDGYDREALAHMISCCIRSSNHPIGDVIYFKELLDDISRTVMENRRLEQRLYYGDRKL